ERTPARSDDRLPDHDGDRQGGVLLPANLQAG
ncbi:MAG: hypothetical protein ACJAUC_002764, partial [Planctomycetota bacterium]